MRGAWALVRFLALFDPGTFDGVRRRPFRQLVGECLILCLAFFRGPFSCFGRIEAFGEVAAVSHRGSFNQTSHWMILFPHRATASEVGL
jgi:hypothetical protein